MAIDQLCVQKELLELVTLKNLFLYRISSEMTQVNKHYKQFMTNINQWQNNTHTILNETKMKNNYLFVTNNLFLYRPVSDETTKENDYDLRSFVMQQQNINTTRKTNCDMNIFLKWLKSEATEKPEQIERERLNKLIARCIMSLKKDDGTEYEPDSILSQQRSIHWYLKDFNVDILQDIILKHLVG